MPEQIKTWNDLLGEAKQLSITESAYCSKCETCSGSCPKVNGMDLLPRYIMQLVKAGRMDEVFESKTLAGCLDCMTCNLVCHQGGDVKSIMGKLKQMAATRTETRQREPSEDDLKHMSPVRLLS